MLVLTRNLHQTIIIGKPGDVLTEPIVVSVEMLRNDKVQLGFVAQADVQIARDDMRFGPVGEPKPASGSVNRNEGDL